MDIPVIFEDREILVIDKPSGLPVLPDGWDNSAPYLKNILETKFNRLWTVHRLDKTTSGVLLFARNPVSHRSLNMQFEQHHVIKKYHAILVGAPNWTEYQVTHPLRQNSGHSHRTVIDWKNGKISSTLFKVVITSNEYTLVEANPYTGRTHQIRAHAESLKHPILADSMYGAPPTEIISRPALHAISLQFKHPLSGKDCLFSASYPQDFQQALLRIDINIQNLDPKDIH